MTVSPQLDQFKTQAEDLSDAIEATELVLLDDDALDRVRPTDMQDLGRRLSVLRHDARRSPLDTTKVEHRVDELESRLGHCKDAYAAARADKSSDDQRLMAAWGAILIVESWLCGFWGMNFPGLPGTEWRIGWLGMAAVQALIGWRLHALFRRRGWL